MLVTLHRFSTVLPDGLSLHSPTTTQGVSIIINGISPACYILSQCISLTPRTAPSVPYLLRPYAPMYRCEFFLNKTVRGLPQSHTISLILVLLSSPFCAGSCRCVGGLRMPDPTIRSCSFTVLIYAVHARSPQSSGEYRLRLSLYHFQLCQVQSSNVCTLLFGRSSDPEQRACISANPPSTSFMCHSRRTLALPFALLSSLVSSLSC